MKELRERFQKETGIAPVFGNRIPYISYIEWLENLIVNSQQTKDIPPLRQKESKHKIINQRMVILYSLIEIISDYFGVAETEIVPKAHLNNDLGLDSLDVVTLQLEIEQRRNIIFDSKSENIFKNCTINDIIDLIIETKG